MEIWWKKITCWFHPRSYSVIQVLAWECLMNMACWKLWEGLLVHSNCSCWGFLKSQRVLCRNLTDICNAGSRGHIHRSCARVRIGIMLTMRARARRDHITCKGTPTSCNIHLYFKKTNTSCMGGHARAWLLTKLQMLAHVVAPWKCCMRAWPMMTRMDDDANAELSFDVERPCLSGERRACAHFPRPR